MVTPPSGDPFSAKAADTPALTDVAERTGEVIAEQVRSVIQAAEAHARSIREEAEQDASRIVNEALEDSTRLRAQIDAVVGPIEELLRDFRDQADRLTAAAPVEVETLTSAVELDTDEVEPAANEVEPSQPYPLSAQQEEAGSMARAGDEADIESEADDRHQADAGMNAADEQWAAAQTKASNVVGREWPAPAGEVSSVPCSDCMGDGSCASCAGSGKRLGFRCGPCGGDGRCPACGGVGVQQAGAAE